MFGVKIALAILSIVLTFGGGNAQLKTLRTLGSWMDMEYEFPSPEHKEAAKRAGQYIPLNGIPIDVDVEYKGLNRIKDTRVFVTVPRFSPGVPITLGTLTGAQGVYGPVIRAYPNYNWQSSHGVNCEGITSVLRVQIDECQRLWVLDSGRIGDNQICTPQLLVFNLNTDVLVNRFKFPPEMVRTNMTLYATPVVDVRDTMQTMCMNTKVYIADVTAFAIIVFDMPTKQFWRVQNKFIYPNPDYGTFTISNESFDLMDGILGLAISPKNLGYERSLYFHALAAITENRVPLSVLDNSTAWRSNPDFSPRSFIQLGNRGSQSAAQVMDRNGNLFFGLNSPNAIACWDSTTPYNRQNIRIVAYDEQQLQFASGMKIVRNNNGIDELWVSTCRFQKVMTNSITNRETNFRILALPVSDLLNGGTRCSPSVGLPTSSFRFPF